jgi:RNA polymerase sigma-70 factor (ECF subfamily)
VSNTVRANTTVRPAGRFLPFFPSVAAAPGLGRRILPGPEGPAVRPPPQLPPASPRLRLLDAAELTEEQIVERHRDGDEEAFEELFRRFASMVYNLTLRMTGDPEQARDLSQEVFLRVFRHLGRFAGRSSIKTWIYRVTLNHCRSRLGRKRLAIDPRGDELAAKVKDPAPSPEQVAMARVTTARLETALLALPGGFREAVVLRDVEGLSYEEIAAVLRVPMGTVRSRIARGRAELRRMLEESR